MSVPACEPVTLRDHLRVLRRRRWLLLIVLMLCGGGAVAYAFLTEPVYEARAELVVADEAGPRSAVLAAAAPVLSMLGDPASALGGDDLATQMQIIDSRPCLEDAWGLMHERSEVLERLASEDLTEELLEDLPEVLQGLGKQPAPSRWPEDWQDLLETLTVTPVEESEIIEVRCEASAPRRARDFTNALVLAYLGRSLSDARSTTRRTRMYVEDQLADVETRLAEAEGSLREFGERAGTVALDESAREQIGLLVRMNEQATIAESTLDAQRALRRELASELSALDEQVVASTITRRNPDVSALQEELARAEAERAGLLEEYAPESMPVRRASAEVEDLRTKLRESAIEVVDSRQEALNPVAQEIAQQMIVAEGEAMAAEQSLSVLRRAAAQVDSELAGLPAEQVALLKLQREIELLERFYLALKEKQQEFELTERMKAPASRLLSHAIVPEEPTRPRKLLAIAGGLGAGLLLGVLAVGLAEQLDEIFRDAQQVASILGVPVIAAFSDMRGNDADEALRGIRRYVCALSRGDGTPAVLVLASVADTDPAVAVATGLVRVVGDDGGKASVLTGDRPTEGSAVGSGDALSPRENALAVAAEVEQAEAEVLVAVAPPDTGLLAASPLLGAGHPVAVVVNIGETPAAEAQSIVELASEHGSGPVVAIVTGSRRSAACYLTPGTRT